MIFDGNIFTGCTGSTITVRNQGGDFPWASLDGLTFSNNYWQGSNQPMVGFLSDSSPTPRTQNVTWTNNLIVGLLGDTAFFPGGVLSGNFQAGTNVTISHNTVAWSKLNNPPMTANAYQNYINFWQRSIGGVTYSATMIGLTVKDNILPVAANICFTDAGAGSNQPMSSCWPSAVVNHNVLVNADSYLMSDINEWWLTYFPSNSLAADYAAVQFTTLDTNLDSSGNYKLLASSPYHNAASDGTDIGVNIDQLFAHIYGVQGPIGISGKFQINGKFRIGQ
jgi:hypothetical protein